ncbi:PD-(D/E)XK nuclease family protein, partial [Candidatus Woesearchaeota archaeon]|nr:PD-(D/E)XK nuclease family protein [Candidatus Woesearchaeota archaeon]
GSKVHNAINDLLKGVVIKMDTKYMNPTTEKDEELTLAEYECLMSFVKWHDKYKPITLSTELVVFNENIEYAGTLDYICKIDNKIYIIDFKTSQNIWQEHKLQLSAYKHCDINAAMRNTENVIKNPKLAILQIGYKRNKDGYKFTEIEDNFKLFLTARGIWLNEYAGVEPKQKDYPLQLSLKKEEVQNDSISEARKR